jgi:hypothetical protein
MVDTGRGSVTNISWQCQCTRLRRSVLSAWLDCQPASVQSER